MPLQPLIFSFSELDEDEMRGSLIANSISGNYRLIAYDAECNHLQTNQPSNQMIVGHEGQDAAFVPNGSEISYVSVRPLTTGQNPENVFDPSWPSMTAFMLRRNPRRFRTMCPMAIMCPMFITVTSSPIFYQHDLPETNVLMEGNTYTRTPFGEYEEQNSYGVSITLMGRSDTASFNYPIHHYQLSNTPYSDGATGYTTQNAYSLTIPSATAQDYGQGLMKHRISGIG